MFIELNLVTDKSRNNTRRCLINTDSILCVEPEYSEPSIGSIVRVAQGDFMIETAIVVAETYDTIVSMLGKQIVVKHG